MLMYRQDENGDIFVSEKTGGDWQLPKKLNKQHQLPRRLRLMPTLLQTARLLYFSTSEIQREWHLDIYVSTRKADGDWGKPKPIRWHQHQL